MAMQKPKKKKESSGLIHKGYAYKLAELAATLFEQNSKSKKSKKISSILKDVKKLKSKSEKTQYKALGRILKNAQEVLDEDA